MKRPLTRNKKFIWLTALAVWLLVAATVASKFPDGQSTPQVTMTYTGMNYYDPTEYFTQCKEWAWLQSWCFTGAAAREPTRAQLASDLSFVNRQHLGGFLRVWVSLDQLMKWSPVTGFDGFAPHALQDVDTALAAFKAHDIAVDLVLFVYSKTTNWTNQFRPAALDGHHPAWRANYLRAESIFIKHLAGNPTDAATVKVVDLQTEPYYQFEQYFKTPAVLGSFTECATLVRIVDSSCVDARIVHPWLDDLYQTARTASHAFLYTFADTGRLLTPERALQDHWISFYPADIYDIHMYDNAPWNHTTRWESYTRLPHPWFAGEAGCGSGNVACTYSGTASTKVDTWWVHHLNHYGARSVLIESHVTLWKYPYGNRSQVLTPTGRMLACATAPILESCHA